MALIRTGGGAAYPDKYYYRVGQAGIANGYFYKNGISDTVHHSDTLPSDVGFATIVANNTMTIVEAGTYQIISLSVNVTTGATTVDRSTIVTKAVGETIDTNHNASNNDAYVVSVVKIA